MATATVRGYGSYVQRGLDTPASIVRIKMRKLLNEIAAGISKVRSLFEYKAPLIIQIRERLIRPSAENREEALKIAFRLRTLIQKQARMEADAFKWEKKLGKHTVRVESIDAALIAHLQGVLKKKEREKLRATLTRERMERIVKTRSTDELNELKLEVAEIIKAHEVAEKERELTRQVIRKLNVMRRILKKQYELVNAVIGALQASKRGMQRPSYYFAAAAEILTELYDPVKMRGALYEEKARLEETIKYTVGQEQVEEQLDKIMREALAIAIGK